MEQLKAYRLTDIEFETVQVAFSEVHKAKAKLDWANQTLALIGNHILRGQKLGATGVDYELSDDGREFRPKLTQQPPEIKVSIMPNPSGESS